MNGQPANTTILIEGGPMPGQTWITLPNAGTVWIVVEGDPLAVCELWHQGGTTTPITPGPANYQVGPGDAIVYALANPADSLKLGWAYL